MTWCDKLSSTPAVGFKLDTHFASSETLIGAVTPILNRLVAGDTPKFHVDRQEAFAVTFTTDDGYTYGIDHNRINVVFKHRMKAKPVSGGPPIVEMLSEAMPYTELLGRATERLIEVTLLVSQVKQRSFTRVGVVSTTQTSMDDAPPGVTKLIRHLARPWENETPSFNISLTGLLRSGETWQDRCVHSLNRPEDTDQLMTIGLDWQRTFKKVQAVQERALRQTLEAATKSALDYYEQIAVGDMFDE